jgi:phosphotriesterase-related protein
MATVNSVLGPLDTRNLGFTLTHEHIMFVPMAFRDYPELLGHNYVERLISDLKRAKDGGVDTIVDATTIDQVRDIKLMADSSRRSGINIICCSGWWLDIPRFFSDITIDQLAEIFTRECEQGISNTNIKAGILKASSDTSVVKPEEELVLRAVARAHLRTGTPITLHSHAQGQVGRYQLAVLKEEGVDLRRVMVGHVNDTTDTKYLFWLLQQGCYLGMDRYPGRGVTSEERTKTLKTLIDAGYAHRICLSHDRWIMRIIDANKDPIEDERLKLNPHGFLYIKKVVFPELQRMGISKEVLESLCVDGTRNYFEGILHS